MKVVLSNEKVYEGNLLLVNVNFPMQTDDKKELVPAIPNCPEVLLKRKAADILQQVFQVVGCEEGIVPVSGYRSAKEQTAIYENSLRESGEEFTRKFVALPYHSEHQTGLAIDLGLKKDEIDFICPEFPYEGMCDAFRRTAPDYGFIERYPKGKEDITGIAHEPWHFRYVGCPHSQIMRERNLTLEEYSVFVKNFSQASPFLWPYRNSKDIAIFYVEAQTVGETIITLPEGSAYEVSGNNMDGFVVTLWRYCDE